MTNYEHCLYESDIRTIKATLMALIDYRCTSETIKRSADWYKEQALNMTLEQAYDSYTSGL